jgi:hypothetical protein
LPRIPGQPRRPDENILGLLDALPKGYSMIEILWDTPSSDNVQLPEAVLKKCAITPMGNACTITLKFGGNSWKGSRGRTSPAWRR